MGDENKRGESLDDEDDVIVGLGLTMQHNTESFPSKTKKMIDMNMMMVMPHLPPYQHHHHHHHSSNNNNKSSINDTDICSSYSTTMTSSNSSSSVVSHGIGDGDGGGGPIYCNLSNYNNNYSSDLYDVVGVARPGGGGCSVSVQQQRTNLTNTAPPHLHSSPKQTSGAGGSIMSGGGGKGAFTVSQWEELERQTIIFKYIMASIPVPSHLLLPFNSTFTPSSCPSSLSSSQTNINTCGLDLRYTRGGSRTDAEPWRCRRTDGKKWRCSRDVAPYQKYCERHAHKPRPRSRKPVEQQQIQPHITTTNTNANSSFNSINNDSTSQPFQRQVFHIPAMVSEATYAQPRCTEWFMKGDPIPGSALNENWQQLVQTSQHGLKLYDEHDRNLSVLRRHYGEEREMLHTNTYVGMNNDQSFQNQRFLQRSLNDDDLQAQTTRHFIDAWSCADREEEMGEKSSISLGEKLPLSSLTLSMSGGITELDEENTDTHMGMGKGFKPEWLNSATYACGGPLGEALCLGISNSAKGPSNLSSPHGYSNSTTTSSCSKSSCEDNNNNVHGLHFH